jgi:hypothetical protein
MTLIETSDSEKKKNEMLLLLKTVSNSLNDAPFNEVINIRNNIGFGIGILKPKSIYRDRAKCAFRTDNYQKRFFLERSSK